MHIKLLSSLVAVAISLIVTIFYTEADVVLHRKNDGRNRVAAGQVKTVHAAAKIQAVQRIPRIRSEQRSPVRSLYQAQVRVKDSVRARGAAGRVQLVTKAGATAPPGAPVTTHPTSIPPPVVVTVTNQFSTRTLRTTQTTTAASATCYLSQKDYFGGSLACFICPLGILPGSLSVGYISCDSVPVPVTGITTTTASTVSPGTGPTTTSGPVCTLVLQLYQGNLIWCYTCQSSSVYPDATMLKYIACGILPPAPPAPVSTSTSTTTTTTTTSTTSTSTTTCPPGTVQTKFGCGSTSSTTTSTSSDSTTTPWTDTTSTTAKNTAVSQSATTATTSTPTSTATAATTSTSSTPNPTTTSGTTATTSTPATSSASTATSSATTTTDTTTTTS